MVGPVNKKIKHEYLFRRNVQGFDYFEKHFADDVDDYMNRPHGKLKGVKPLKALSSGKQNDTDYSDKIQHAILARITENIGSNCNECEPEINNN